MPSSHVFAPAKINLTLKITDKRADGYHVMDSLVIFAELQDTLTLTPSSQDTLAITGPHADMLKATPREDNIIFIVANRYRAQTAWQQHFAITLDKHIPVAAGIGGGSSDAAAILFALNDICPTPMAMDELYALGLAIGADVPVCLRGHEHHLWRMRGIGEQLTPVHHTSSSSFGLVLMNPGITVPTAGIFNALRPDDIIDNGFGQGRDLSESLNHDDMMQWLEDGNSLTAPAARLHHEIQEAIMIMQQFKHHDGFLAAGMSGSGATVFTLFENSNNAISASAAIAAIPNWHWAGGVFLPTPLSRCCYGDSAAQTDT